MRQDLGCPEMSSHHRISSRDIIPSDARVKRFTLAAILRRGLRLGEGDGTRPGVVLYSWQ